MRCLSVLTLCQYLSVVGSGGRSSDGISDPTVLLFGTHGSDWGISSVDGRDGVFVYVEHSEAVTPVARETLLSMWMISSSGI